jgi:hypothetical protein
MKVLCAVDRDFFRLGIVESSDTIGNAFARRSSDEFRRGKDENIATKHR